MGKSRLQIAKKNISNYFKKKKGCILKRSEIISIASQKGKSWNLAKSMTKKEFFEFLIENNMVEEYILEFPNRTEIRYVLGKLSEYKLIQSLRPNSYFSHYSALTLHQLTTKRLKLVYLNYEQPKKRNSDNQLLQKNIDLAFQNSCRKSNNIAKFDDKKICLLNGKFTGQLGVISIQVDKSSSIQVTNIERTLIDCTVRPIYAGGVDNVLLAALNDT